jgi:protein tyrosine phosphatase (PTP) superfamily phosphohydrolase (DUF442 family)
VSVTANTATDTPTEAPTAERAQRPRRGRRLRLGALILVAVVAGSLIQGNIVLVGVSWLARGTTDLDAGPKLEGVRKLYVVDGRVWRGAQPRAVGFRSLAEEGVTTVVDLRPSSRAARDAANLRGLGINAFHMPVTDGRPPSPSQVRQFVDIVDDSSGRVFLHCGEGVGRAGTMAAAYRVTTGQTDARTAVRESLAVGVLTLEQISFISSLDRDAAHEPPAIVKAVSRYLDGPRQLFNRFLS